MRAKWSEAVFFGILVALVALVGRLAHIHAAMGDDLTQRAQRQHTARRPVPAQRGTIYDRRGRILAGSDFPHSLFADPYIIDRPDQSASLVVQLTGRPYKDTLRRITANDRARFVWLARHIDAGVVEQFRGLNPRERRGLGLKREPRRHYPAATLAGHILGAVTIDDRGLEGLERQYHRLLAATWSTETFVRDAAGRKIWLIGRDYEPPKNGKSLILTIDAVMQEFTETTLDETCRKFDAKSGCAILMDPTTGDILAWACWPPVDPNRFGKSPPDHRRNRGLTDPFEPGSVFKPFIAVAALRHKVVTLKEKIFCHNGAYVVGRRTLRDHHGRGDLTFDQIVIYSSNIGMAILGERLGNKRLYEAARAFGFGRKTGIDLPGEDGGIVRPLARWNDYSTRSIPMGQEIAATAVQLITAFAALANDGMMLRPRLLRAVIDEHGRVVRDNTAIVPLGQAIDPAIARYMVQNVLARVVTEGTGRRAAIPRHQVFGKTGTAQVAKRGGGGYKERAYVSSFLAGLPASAPKLVALVTIREPDRSIGHFGGTVAAPAVKSILEKTVKYLGIPPVEPGQPAQRIPVNAG